MCTAHTSRERKVITPTFIVETACTDRAQNTREEKNKVSDQQCSIAILPMIGIENESMNGYDRNGRGDMQT